MAMAEILVIDDDRQMRQLLVRILEGSGYRVCQAENGRVGIDLFRRRRPALVISDIMMPDVEGIETIRTLRRDEPTLPIIAISGGGEPVYLRAATCLGASAALEKPFAGDALVMLVGSLLAR